MFLGVHDDNSIKEGSLKHLIYNILDNAPYDITLSSQGVNGGAYGNAHELTDRITKFRAMMNYLNLPTEGII